MRSNYYKKTARLLEQAAETTRLHDQKLREQEENAIKAEREVVINEAYLGSGSYLHNKREKRLAAERGLNYSETFTVKALTEMLTVVCEESLLLNRETYAELNPNYRNEIKATIKSFLENADINQNVNVKETLDLFEEIKKEIPQYDLYLSEADETAIISDKLMSNKKVEDCLAHFKNIVPEKVADIVAKDQARLADEQHTLELADEKELEAAPIVPVQEPVVDEYAPLPDEDAPVAEAPVAEPVTESYVPKKVRVAKEASKQGLLESLAINEATKMIEEGKEYNKDLALANSLKYITILETLGATGLIEVGENKYNDILASCGVDVKQERIKKANMKAPEMMKTAGEDKLEQEHSILTSAFPKGFIVGNDPYAGFEKLPKVENKVDVPEEVKEHKVEAKPGDYVKDDKVFTESALRSYFEDQGFNLDFTDFEELARSWAFRKVK